MSNVQVQIGGNTVQVQVQSSGFARANAAVTLAADSATAAAASAAAAAATLAGAALKANNLSDLASASTARTNLGLGSIATQAASAVAITGGSIAGITDLAVADGGTGASSASAARDNLGLTIGTNVQAYDADLAAIAALTSAANKAPYATGAGTWALADQTAFARTLMDDADAGAARTTLAAVGTAELAASTGAALVGSIQSGTGAVAETAQVAMRRVMYPEQFGAVGDGSTNDATAMQNAITAAAAANAVLNLRPGKNYRCTTGLTIPANSVINFNGATVSTAANITLLSITASNITLIRPKLRGPSGTYNSASIGIYLSGTVNGAAVAPTFISDIKILEPDIQDFGYLCIQPLYVERMVITNPVAKNFGYGFMVTQGTRDCVGIGGVFLDATGLVEGGALECFAVSWSGNDGSTDYVRYPNSERCVWFGGFAKGFSWQPFDTHGGVDCGFVGPVIRDSRRAVWLTTRSSSTGPVRCFARDVDAVNTSTAFATYADSNEKRGEAFLIGGSADTNASTRAQSCFISGRATGYGGLVGSVGAAKTQFTDHACGMDVQLINPYAVGLEISSGSRGFYRVVIDNPQSPGTGGSTTAPRYVGLTSSGSDVVSVRVDAEMLRSDSTLNTYVGTRAFVSSTGLSGSSVNFTRFTSDPAIDLAVSQDGIALGEYPASFTLSVAGLDVTTMVVTIRREGPWAVMSSSSLIIGTSNSTAFTLGTTIPLPTYMRPSGTRRLYAKIGDNSNLAWGEAELSTGGVFTLYRDMVGNTWTASGSKRLYDFTWRWLV